MAALIPDDPDTLLRRKGTAGALTAKGFPTSDTTLATMATRGGGPPYHLYGRIPLYRWGDVLAWAMGRLSPARRSTSEHEFAAHLMARQSHDRTASEASPKAVPAARRCAAKLGEP